MAGPKACRNRALWRDHCLCPHDDGVLPEHGFEVLAVFAPPIAVERVRHDLDSHDVVAHGLAATFHSPCAGLREQAVSPPYRSASSERTRPNNSDENGFPALA